MAHDSQSSVDPSPGPATLHTAKTERPLPTDSLLYNAIDSRFMIGGVAMMMVGYFSLAPLNLEVGMPQLMPGLLLTGAGMSFMFGPMSAIVMRIMPRPSLTAAASLYTLAGRIGGNVGYALVAG